MLKYSTHAPVHLLLDDTPYFITAAIYQKRRLLQTSAMKNRLLELLHDYFHRNAWELHHWVILDNHYHLIGKSRKGTCMPKIFRNVHAIMAKDIVAMSTCEKLVWWSYWDYCPRDEEDYMIRLNYLLFNPVKHGYTTDLHSYAYSSFHVLYENIGRENLATQFQEHPEDKTLILHEAYDDDF